MGTPLFLGLVAVLVLSVVGIVAVSSTLERDKRQRRPPLDREANPQANKTSYLMDVTNR
jgi:hypothetical protein